MATASTPRVLVVGAGAVGLRTALELVRRQVSVVLRAPRHPLHPSTCSMGAGGLWMPFHCDDPRTDRWALETLNEWMHMVDSEDKQNKSLVEIVPAVSLLQQHRGPTVEDFAHETYEKKIGRHSYHKLPAWSEDPRLHFQHLTVEMLSWQNAVYQLRLPPQEELVEAGYDHAWFFYPPIVNATGMLDHWLNELTQHEHTRDVNVETGHYYESMEELLQEATDLECQAVVNCAGLGSRTLLKDDSLVGARGILHHYDRSNCPRRPAVHEGMHGNLNTKDAVIMVEDGPWGSNEHPCYLIPRGDTIVVGGTYLEGDDETEIRPAEREQLLTNANLLGIDTEAIAPVGEWTGFRPFRPQIRCERDTASSAGLPVFHNYGMGGSGWTVTTGAARECVDRVVEVLLK